MSKDSPERTAVAPIKSNVPSLNMTEAELMNVLRSSIYPGAKDESIKLAIGYCKAQQLDPLQKPVHIVPMDVKEGGEYVKRDVIMPGIGLYRTQAARTGEYVGKSAPVFGQLADFKFGDTSIEIPQSCTISVFRLVGGEQREYTAMEFWRENYGTAGRGTIAPNAMWKKRPFAQLAKCAEAQALRMAFPEAVGAAPTAEEMEGKHDEEYIDQSRQIEDPQRADTGKAVDTKPPAETSASSRESPPKGDEGAAGKPAHPPVQEGAAKPKDAPPADARTQTHLESGGTGTAAPAATTNAAPPADAGGDPLTDGQIRVVTARMIASGIAADKVAETFQAEWKIPLAVGSKISVNRILTWARELASKKK